MWRRADMVQSGPGDWILFKALVIPKNWRFGSWAVLNLYEDELNNMSCKNANFFLTQILLSSKIDRINKVCKAAITHFTHFIQSQSRKDNIHYFHPVLTLLDICFSKTFCKTQQTNEILNKIDAMMGHNFMLSFCYVWLD